jgi:GDP-L-fucose synthase
MLCAKKKGLKSITILSDMLENAKIYVAGHSGLVGSAIFRQLRDKGFVNIVVRSHSDLDLTNQVAVAEFFAYEKPEYVFLAAARVGGIYANSICPAEFIYQNLMIQSNIIHNSYLYGAKRLLFLGSSCIYPRLAPQPIKEEYLMTGSLESTNSSYAIAKISGIEMCWSYNRQYGTQFIPVMPTNLYGTNDNFDLENSHVVPALIRKVHEAKTAGADSVTIWGTGTPRREFLYVDDLAEACIHIMSLPDESLNKILNETQNDLRNSWLINIGTGTDITIQELAKMICKVIGFRGGLVFDRSKPDGTPRKLLDISRLKALGWFHKVPLEEGIKRTYEWFIANVA